jgi:hypothetical protein
MEQVGERQYRLKKMGNKLPMVYSLVCTNWFVLINCFYTFKLYNQPGWHEKTFTLRIGIVFCCIGAKPNGTAV